MRTSLPTQSCSRLTRLNSRETRFSFSAGVRCPLSNCQATSYCPPLTLSSDANPPEDIHEVFESLKDLETLPALSTKNATMSVSDMLNVYPDPAGFRKGWWDTSIRAGDASVLEAVIDNYGTWVQENMADKSRKSVV